MLPLLVYLLRSVIFIIEGLPLQVVGFHDIRSISLNVPTPALESGNVLLKPPRYDNNRRSSADGLVRQHLCSSAAWRSIYQTWSNEVTTALSIRRRSPDTSYLGRRLLEPLATQGTSGVVKESAIAYRGARYTQSQTLKPTISIVSIARQSFTVSIDKPGVYHQTIMRIKDIMKTEVSR